MPEFKLPHERLQALEQENQELRQQLAALNRNMALLQAQMETLAPYIHNHPQPMSMGHPEDWRRFMDQQRITLPSLQTKPS